MLLGILARVTSLAYRIGHEEIERGALESRVLMVAKKLEGDLLGSSAAGLTLTPDGSRLAIHPLDSVTSSSRVLFKPEFAIWNWNDTSAGGGVEHRLTRSEIDARPDAVPFDGGAFRWTQAQIAALSPVPTGRVTLQFDDVAKFEITNPTGVQVPQVGSPLSFLIQVDLPLARTRKSIGIKRTLLVRTGGA